MLVLRAACPEPVTHGSRKQPQVLLLTVVDPNPLLAAVCRRSGWDTRFSQLIQSFACFMVMAVRWLLLWLLRCLLSFQHSFPSQGIPQHSMRGRIPASYWFLQYHLLTFDRVLGVQAGFHLMSLLWHSAQPRFAIRLCPCLSTI